MTGAAARGAGTGACVTGVGTGAGTGFKIGAGEGLGSGRVSMIRIVVETLGKGVPFWPFSGNGVTVTVNVAPTTRSLHEVKEGPLLPQ